MLAVSATLQETVLTLAPLFDAPESPAEIDTYLSEKFFPRYAPDGQSPGADIERRLVELGSSGISVPIYKLGVDPNGFIEEGNIEFLNLPSGWSATYRGGSDRWVHLTFPTTVAAGQVDLRFRLTDSQGLASNVGVLRLVFVARNWQNPVQFFDVTHNGKVDYRDLLAIERQVQPLPPYIRPVAGSDNFCYGRYCDEPAEVSVPVKFWDLSQDGIANQADIEIMQAHLDANSIAKVAPRISESDYPVMVRAGELADLHLSRFGNDPDGDDRSYTLVVLDAGPLTITQDDTYYQSVRIAAPASADGKIQVRYQLRDHHGLLSEEGTFAVQVTPALDRFHNSLQAADVDRDGFVSPLDALLIFNLLRTTGSNMTNLVDPAVAWDVSNDQHLTPLDALLVLNYLNARADFASEESVAQLTDVATGAENDDSQLTSAELFVALQFAVDEQLS